MKIDIIMFSLVLFLSFFVIFILTVHPYVFEEYNFKSIIIYKKVLLSNKHFISKWFKNTVEYPKFKLYVVYLFITILTDIPMYVLIVFFYNSTVFICIYGGYIFFKLIRFIMNGKNLFKLDNKCYEEQLMMSKDELENVFKEIEEAHPGFFNEWID